LKMDGSCRGQGTKVNSFAVVGYLGGQLGEYLDRLRSELRPGCQARSHVTVLPPRPLEAPPEEAWNETQSRMAEIGSIHVQLGDVQIFPGSMAIYLSIGSGFQELEQLHKVLSSGRMRFVEPFEYHPHVTLAKDVPTEKLGSTIDLAQRRWREYAQPRSFTLERLVFVQNTLENWWVDLNVADLAGQTISPQR